MLESPTAYLTSRKYPLFALGCFVFNKNRQAKQHATIDASLAALSICNKSQLVAESATPIQSHSHTLSYTHTHTSARFNLA